MIISVVLAHKFWNSSTTNYQNGNVEYIYIYIYNCDNEYYQHVAKVKSKFYLKKKFNIYICYKILWNETLIMKSLIINTLDYCITCFKIGSSPTMFLIFHIFLFRNVSRLFPASNLYSDLMKIAIIFKLHTCKGNIYWIAEN